jgi:hypothetical protein
MSHRLFSDRPELGYVIATGLVCVSFGDLLLRFLYLAFIIDVLILSHAMFGIVLTRLEDHSLGFQSVISAANEFQVLVT